MAFELTLTGEGETLSQNLGIVDKRRVELATIAQEAYLNLGLMAESLQLAARSCNTLEELVFVSALVGAYTERHE